VKSDPSEYKGIIKKLLEKTREGRVGWVEDAFNHNSFSYSVGEPKDRNRIIARPTEPDAFSFTVASGGTDGMLSLTMRDQSEHEIFRAEADDLPTSPDEAEISTLLEELYDLARRQALKIEQKLEVAATLLDRV
jgi:hypothetical protein